MGNQRKEKMIQGKSDSYTVLNAVGSGGNGNVNKCKSNKDNKVYAVKILNRKFKQKDSAFIRFLRERDFCMQTDHTNIIKVIDYGEIDGLPFTIMPMYSQSLKNFIKNQADNTDYATKIDYILQICHGLKEAHAKNIIHRDIKPANILIDEDKNKVVVADFGIAHFEDSDLTKTGNLMANRNYASPEQRKEKHGKRLTKAVDIYGLGCIINELFTKEIPVGSDYQLISDYIPELYQLDDVVAKCLSQKPEDRPEIMDVILDIIEIKETLDAQIAQYKEWLEDDALQEGIEITDQIACVVDRAARDIFIGEYLFDNKNNEELSQYNSHYNCYIHYKINESLQREYFSKLLLTECIYQNDYEKRGECRGYPYDPIDFNIPRNKELLETLHQKIADYGIKNNEIDYHFKRCCATHCNEIIQKIPSMQKDSQVLGDAPIIYILQKIRQEFPNDLDGNKNIAACISINWKETIAGFNQEYEDSDSQLLYEIDTTKAQTVIKKFKDRFKNINVKEVDEYYQIKFLNKHTYEQFKQEAIEKQEKGGVHYLVDIKDMLKIENESDGIIKVKKWDYYDITTTLAVALGLKEIQK